MDEPSIAPFTEEDFTTVHSSSYSAFIHLPISHCLWAPKPTLTPLHIENQPNLLH
jgi:hypothetical protein